MQRRPRRRQRRGGRVAASASAAAVYLPGDTSPATTAPDRAAWRTLPIQLAETMLCTLGRQTTCCRNMSTSTVAPSICCETTVQTNAVTRRGRISRKHVCSNGQQQAGVEHYLNACSMWHGMRRAVGIERMSCKLGLHWWHTAGGCLRRRSLGPPALALPAVRAPMRVATVGAAVPHARTPAAAAQAGGVAAALGSAHARRRKQGRWLCRGRHLRRRSWLCPVGGFTAGGRLS